MPSGGCGRDTAGRRTYELFTTFSRSRGHPRVPADVNPLRNTSGVRINTLTMFNPRPTQNAIMLLGSVAAIAAVTGLLRMIPNVSPTTAAVALLLVVLVTATKAQLQVALVTSVAAMLTLNFFFLPPIGTFIISEPQNWIALFVFLTVAIIASNLSAAAQDRAREAIARRNELTRLFELTRDILLTTETASAIEVLARHVAHRFELSGAAICLPDDYGWRIVQGGAD